MGTLLQTTATDTVHNRHRCRKGKERAHSTCTHKKVTGHTASVPPSSGQVSNTHIQGWYTEVPKGVNTIIEKQLFGCLLRDRLQKYLQMSWYTYELLCTTDKDPHGQNDLCFNWMFPRMPALRRLYPDNSYIVRSNESLQHHGLSVRPHNKVSST